MSPIRNSEGLVHWKSMWRISTLVQWSGRWIGEIWSVRFNSKIVSKRFPNENFRLFVIRYDEGILGTVYRDRRVLNSIIVRTFNDWKSLIFFHPVYEVIRLMTLSLFIKIPRLGVLRLKSVSVDSSSLCRTTICKLEQI